MFNPSRRSAVEHEIKVWWPKISSIPTRIKPVIGSASWHRRCRCRKMMETDGNSWKGTCHLGNRKKRNMQTTQCSAHHKQNPSELKVDSSSPLNHQWARDFTALQRNYGDFLILWSFSVSKHPLPSRGSTQKVLNLPGSKIGTLSAVDQDTTTVGGACPSLVIGSRKWSKSVPTDHKNWSINHGRPNNKPSSIEDYYWVYSVVGHL